MYVWIEYTHLKLLIDFALFQEWLPETSGHLWCWFWRLRYAKLPPSSSRSPTLTDPRLQSSSRPRRDPSGGEFKPLLNPEMIYCLVSEKMTIYEGIHLHDSFELNMTSPLRILRFEVFFFSTFFSHYSSSVAKWSTLIHLCEKLEFSLCWTAERFWILIVNFLYAY